MALQGSGAISISQIKTELGSSSNSLRTLSAAAGFSSPDSMSEFYGFASYTPPSYSSGASSISGAGTQASPYVVTTAWSGTRGVTSEHPVPSLGSYDDVYSNSVSMTQLNFTNNTAGQQRMHVTYTASSNFCSFAGHAFDYASYYGLPEEESAFANSYVVVNSNVSGVSVGYSSDGSSSPTQQLNSQYRSTNFTLSSGSNIQFTGSGNQVTFVVSRVWSGPFDPQGYLFPCGEQMYGNVPSPSMSVTLTIWFELV